MSSGLRKRLLALAGRRPAERVTYRDGVWNRADEIVAADRYAREYIDAGILTMGPYSYHPPRIRMFAGDRGKITIGSYTSLAKGTEIFVGGAHRDDWVTSYGLRIVFGLPGAFEDGTPASRGEVVIGSDVWVAHGSTILSGVTIGDGAVVAARSVVTNDVRPYSMVAGNPAREVRMRFPADQIEALQRIRWWNWPVEKVLENVELLSTPDIAAFISAHDPERPARPSQAPDAL